MSEREAAAAASGRARPRGMCALLAGALLVGVALQAQEAASPSGLGRPPTAAEQRDRIVGPDGADLPPGSGTPVEGEMVFSRRGCATCHGPTGTEGPSIALVGGDITTRSNYFPIRYWPFAPSIWDYIRRVMPYDRPGILSDDETYALTAYLLYRNGVIGNEDVLTADTLPAVTMPHRDDYRTPPAWTPATPRGFRIVPEP